MIASDEAAKEYPYALYKNKKLYWSDIRLAYFNGRIQDPCDEQIEAAAISLMSTQSNLNEDTLSSYNNMKEYWDNLPDMVKDSFRNSARKALEAAVDALFGNYEDKKENM